MSEIFISYAKKDHQVAARLAHTLQEIGEVFWDKNIEPGGEWSAEIQGALHDARCVVVLWSEASKKSFWVRGEAADAFERETYVPVLIDRSEPPKLFSHLQALSLVDWVEKNEEASLANLKSHIVSRIGELPMYGILEPVADGEPVTNKHLHLIHSCWRVNKTTKFGFMPYQIQLIVYGHHTALARVKSVEYMLPEYPEDHGRQPGGPPERLFELKELANGFSIAQAVVQLHSQPAGYKNELRLSRFINMSESGPRLFDDFIRRIKPIS